MRGGSLDLRDDGMVGDRCTEGNVFLNFSLLNGISIIRSWGYTLVRTEATAPRNQFIHNPPYRAYSGFYGGLTVLVVLCTYTIPLLFGIKLVL